MYTTTSSMPAEVGDLQDEGRDDPHRSRSADNASCTPYYVVVHQQENGGGRGAAGGATRRSGHGAVMWDS